MIAAGRGATLHLQMHGCAGRLDSPYMYLTTCRRAKYTTVLCRLYSVLKLARELCVRVPGRESAVPLPGCRVPENCVGCSRKRIS